MNLKVLKETFIKTNNSNKITHFLSKSTFLKLKIPREKFLKIHIFEIKENLKTTHFLSLYSNAPCEKIFKIPFFHCPGLKFFKKPP